LTRRAQSNSGKGKLKERGSREKGGKETFLRKHIGRSVSLLRMREDPRAKKALCLIREEIRREEEDSDKDEKGNVMFEQDH